MMDTAHERVKGLLAAYALDAVPEEEIRMIRDHILSCEECMAEADSNAQATMALGAQAEAVELPAGFADRVMAQVAQESGVATQPKVSRRRTWRIFQVAAGVAMLAIIGVLSVSLSSTRAELKQVRGASWDMEGTRAAGKLLPTGGGSLLVLAGLEEPPEGRTYQLWMMEGDCLERAGGSCEYVSAGTFQSSSDGIALVGSNLELEDFDGSGITIEPEGGSPQPTTDPIITSV